MGCFFCFNCLYDRSLSLLLAKPHQILRLLSQSFPFPHNSVSTTPPKLGPRVFAHLPNLRVVCHSVYVYWLAFLLHTAISLLSAIRSMHIEASALPPLSDSCLSSGMADPPPSYGYTRGQQLRHPRAPSV